MGNSATKETSEVNNTVVANQKPGEKPKACKACCACPETKKVRDAW